MTPARPHPEAPPPHIPSDLTGPVEVALAKSANEIPGPHALPGGSRYEVKWDGYRVAIVRDGRGARLWTRNRNDISDRFPDIVAGAAQQLAAGIVLDGELVVLGADGRLSFDALQQRLVTSPAKARTRAAQLPAAYAASICSQSGEWICAPSAGPSAGSASSSSRARGCLRCS